MKAARSLTIFAAALALAGCTVGPNYKTPQVAMPGNFAGMPTTRPATAATTRPVDLALWWKSLDDPELNSLVNRAIAANFDLQIALDRLQEARTEEVVIAGGALPMVDMSGAVARGSGTSSVKDRIGGPLNAATNTNGYKEITQVVGFDAGWELDVFGLYRRELESAQDSTQAAAEARNDLLVGVISDVAQAYMDVRTLQMRLQILRNNIDLEQQTVNVVQQRYARGITNELDLALATRQLASLQAEVAPLQAQMYASQRDLAVLLGEYPEDLNQELLAVGQLPQVPEKIQAGLPLDLLRRRPDIREAERELASNTALIGADTANLFPRVAVTAGAGLQGQGFGRPNLGPDFIWSAGPEAYWPVLDFGALDAEIDIQDLRTREALIDYKKTIVNAVEEVDNALTEFSASQESLQSLADALTASQQAVTLASKRYNRGLTDFLNVTDAERQLYELEDQYVQAQETVVLEYIAVYRSLGGGWETFQKIPPIRQPQPAIIAAIERTVTPDDSYK